MTGSRLVGTNRVRRASAVVQSQFLTAFYAITEERYFPVDFAATIGETQGKEESVVSASAAVPFRAQRREESPSPDCGSSLMNGPLRRSTAILRLRKKHPPYMTELQEIAASGVL